MIFVPPPVETVIKACQSQAEGIIAELRDVKVGRARMARALCLNVVLNSKCYQDFIQLSHAR